MPICQHCGQGALVVDRNGPVCPDCVDEGRYEPKPEPKQEEPPTCYQHN